MSESIDDVYTSNSLACADLKGKNVTLTIDTAEVKQFDNGQKIILSFRETDKTFVCNKTNAKRIAESHGPKYRLWPGKKITMYPDRVEFKGDIVDAIRVAFPKRSEPDAPIRQSENPADGLDDEIPF